jgi:predicted Zn-dependent protease
MRNFNFAVSRIEPVAEQMCRQRGTQQNCDFKIVVDDRPGQPVNAYQTLDRSGRPIIAFTVPLIADARSRDEIAFVMAHEAAHHIEGHIARQQQNAALGAVLLGTLAGAMGTVEKTAISTAQRLGASVGARTYSKDFELEADALGTRIAAAAGFDPLKGAQFFFRIPDPGDKFLGTHPANADRLRTVQRVAAGF